MADFAAGVVGVVISVLSFWVLSTLFAAGWAALLGFTLGAVFSWVTYLTLTRQNI